ncbi:MAG: Mrp/NBP35 family ATP-binding protein [Dehalococcoidales bacterium]
MVTEEQVRKSIGEILVPGVKRSLKDMNLLRDVAVDEDKTSVTLASSGLSEGVQDWLRSKIKDAVAGLKGDITAEVTFIDVKVTEVNDIGAVIAVMSGKGGVGKSLVASLTAVALKRQGYGVGILDADITGPSIPKMLGVREKPVGSNTGIMPVISRSGIEMISFNLILDQEEDAVIWRGPLISKAITQFWEEVVWGKLDYLVVDLPPGTADAPLTVMQILPVSGVIIVSTPQDLTNMIVKKAVGMARKMDKPILGVVENMSYLYVPEIDKKIELFGRSKGEEMAQAAEAPLLGTLPIDPELARLCDEGNIERYRSDAFDSMTAKLASAMNLPGAEKAK